MEYWRNELYHHGIKGQKWGVRRYQNFDGSYTQAGLKRYGVLSEKYDSSREKYKAEKAAYKSGTGSKESLKAARAEMRADRRAATKQYRQLKRDKLADQGKELYSRGKTVTGNSNKVILAGLGVTAAAGITTAAIRASGKEFTIKNYKIPASTMANMVGFGMEAAGALGIGAMQVKNAYENKRLRAYYAH